MIKLAEEGKTTQEFAKEIHNTEKYGTIIRKETGNIYSPTEREKEEEKEKE